MTISLLHEADPIGRIESSLTTWASFLDSPKFWKAFVDEYKQDSELLSEEAISEFQRNAASDLSDIYAEIQEVWGGENFVYRFQQLFNARGKKIEENILNPVFHAIQTAIEQLEQVKLGETDNYDSAKASQLKADVYKRQGLEGPFGNPSIRNALRLAIRAADRPRARKSAAAITRDILDQLLATCWRGRAVDLRAVSYTHLDVYKRQALQGGCARTDSNHLANPA